MHHPVGELGRGLVVADDDERRPARGDQLAEQAVDDARGAPVELAGGLVGEQQRGRVGERRTACDALLLAPGERRGRVIGALGESHRREQVERLRAALARRDAASARGSATFSAQVSAGESARA